MVKRVLVYLENNQKIESLLESAKLLKAKYPCEVNAVYVRDVRKHEVIPPSIDGVVVDPSSRYIIESWSNYEEEQVKRLKGELAGSAIDNFVVRDGITPEVILEELKGYDFLMLKKGRSITSDLKEVLKYHYKPIILLGEKDLNLDKIVFADGKNYNSNKSIFRFMGIFNDIQAIQAIAINKEDENDNSIKEYLNGSEIEYSEEEATGEAYDIIAEKVGSGLLIMGDLSHSFLFDKLTGQTGVKILEELPTSIFIA